MIEVSDWDEVVQNTYGKPYSFQQQDDCKPRGTFEFTVPDESNDFENDTVPEEVNPPDMGVSFAAWLARDPAQKLPPEENSFGNDYTNMWWERNFYPDMQMIANNLYAKGLLDAGEYIINIDW